LVLTQDALSSPWVEQEINAAIRLKHQGRIQGVLPIQVGAVDLRGIPPLWGVYNVFDATRDYASGRDAVIRALGLNSPLAPMPPAVKGEPFTPQWLRAPRPSGQGLLDNGLPEWLRGTQRGAAAQQEPSPTWQKSQPGESAQLITRGRALADARHYDEAQRLFERATQLDPANAEAWNMKGWALLCLRRNGDALAAFQYALALDPNYRDAWVNKGSALRRLGRTAEAAEAERQAKALGG
jgi:tetratricopeptide (TPR) repeat protein